MIFLLIHLVFADMGKELSLKYNPEASKKDGAEADHPPKSAKIKISSNSS